MSDKGGGVITHGHAQVGKLSPTYRSWRAMRRRCLDPKYHAFHRYGGRGIAVVAAWACSFDRFLADMGERPEGTTLERVKADVGYQPGNCVWAPKLVQARNTSTNRFLTIDGVTLCCAEWAERTGVNYHTLITRLQRGWPAERAVTP